MRFRVTLRRKLATRKEVVEAANHKEAMFAADEKVYRETGQQWTPEWAEPVEG